MGDGADVPVLGADVPVLGADVPALGVDALALGAEVPAPGAEVPTPWASVVPAISAPLMSATVSGASICCLLVSFMTKTPWRIRPA